MNANRALIDARLDAIDRALLGRVSRAERLDVVGEVESRIDELLRERCGPGAEPSRDDVLAVLARLDPPEAYLGDEPASSPPILREPNVAPRMSGAASPSAVLERRAWRSGIFGVLAISATAMAALCLALSLAAQSLSFFVVGFGGGTLIGLACGISAVALSAASRCRTGWGITGLVLGVISTLLTLLATIFFVAELS
ncbi:hypothetical protein [Paludisphaera sp.]|uniref:hypothetical protein n=1 Tax=Paludisphaera sp. TaxID=2017432 RepID=UPI00301E2593